ncbi:HalOD1 output domain-containing protein [Halovivax gelatinilyticus]|uniref:HalOD1 output domain-containing protein n=1 Tax=Halovivax gelatinilyticus TaxID=2961597 RepID=UPI0020CA548F|nr:HalOD1 output domain-containing protein [Halovivax gelatinilyticus]
MTDDTTPAEPTDSTQTGSFSYELDPDERPSEAVVHVVATLTDSSILDLNPLYHTIDPEYLDELLADRNNSDTITEASVTVPYNGCHVTVTQDTVRARIDD